MPRVIKAWKDQTLKPTRIIVVDNRKGSLTQETEVYPNYQVREADDVWRWMDNAGCPCHFAPALMWSHKYDYILFADDDFLPGEEVLAVYHAAAQELGGNFATIGGAGRLFNITYPAGKKYSGIHGPDAKWGFLTPCHLTCRCHFVRADYLYHLIPFRQRLCDKFGDEAKRLVDIHDDFLMCLGIQMGTVVNTFVVGKSPDKRQQIFAQSLPETGAVWKRPNHFGERSRMVEMALEIGWRPLL